MRHRRSRISRHLTGAQPLAAWAVACGFGLGGLIDGIVLHQILQWHHLVAGWVSPNTLHGLKTNTFWDGVFDLAMWVLVVAAVFGVRHAAQQEERVPSARRLAGLLLLGWGAFNVVDQLLFHLALGAHHIRMVRGYQLYDWGFFAMGVLVLAVPGWLLARSEDSTGAGPPRGRLAADELRLR